MQSSDDILIQAINEQFGGNWHRIYAKRVNHNKYVYVFECDKSTVEPIVVRNDNIVDKLKRIEQPGNSVMYWHSVLEDPALSGLSEFTQNYQHVKVLRYCPGKRITMSAHDAKQGDIIIKCVASGVATIHQRLRKIWKHCSSMLFEVSEPLILSNACNTFTQSRLPGQPLVFNDTEDSKMLAKNMAIAIGSLHQSSVQFPTTFLCRDQEKRSHRYAKLIIKRFPDLEKMVNELTTKLNSFGTEYDSTEPTPVPIHGSLHSHQWLETNSQLALVDFDRACMGHLELDLATFIAEWDYEPGDIADTVITNFKSAYPNNVNPNLLCYYRVNKHLAKAYKASKSPHRSNAYFKTKRNMSKALTLSKQLPRSV